MSVHEGPLRSIDGRSFAFGATLAVLLTVFALWGCGGEGTPSSRAGGGDSKPAEVGSTPQPSPVEGEVALGRTQIKNLKGQPWRLEASAVDWRESQQGGRADRVRWELLDEKRAVSVVVTAPGALFDMEAERVEFVGQVLAQRPASGDRLTVNRLVWEGKKETFYGSQGVRWKRGKYQMDGENLVADSTLTKVEVSGGVQGMTLLEENLP